MYIVTTFARVWHSFAVKGFWALCDNIKTGAIVMMLKDTFNFYTLLRRNNALEQKTVHRSMTCYVHVLLYNAAK
jgi:hypothetical protein